MNRSTPHSTVATSVSSGIPVASSHRAPRRERTAATIADTTLIPREAMVEDLLFIRRILDESHIGYLLVRGDESRRGTVRPVLAIDARERERVVAALAEACANEPMYSRVAPDSAPLRPAIHRGPKRGHDRKSPVLVSSGSLAGGASDHAFVLYRPRVSASGTLRWGARHGVGLEFWVRDEVDIHLPNANVLSRATIPQGEVAESVTTQFGMTWPSLDGMWDTLASDIDFPIDIVFSWVDGTDLEWQRARAARMQSYVVGEGDDHEARFRQVNELKYAMRSVHMFAPWIRNIVIVTDSPQPDWLADHPRVSVLPSSEFFGDPRALPTYNSHAVESQLHRIDGLSEHFLYSNDDMFFGREVGPQAFFTSGGISRFIEADTRIGLGLPAPFRSGFENAARVNRALLMKRFGRTITRHLEHCPTPLRRSVLEELEAEFPADFTRTARSRFRSATDISVTNSLYHYFALMTGRAVPNESMRVTYVDTTTRAGIAGLAVLLRDRDRDFFCLNDGSFPEISAEARVEAVTAFLEGYFPLAAPWELGER